MRRPQSVASLDKLGRVRLSKQFFMRDMLHSEIAPIDVQGRLTSTPPPA